MDSPPGMDGGNGGERGGGGIEKEKIHVVSMMKE